MQSSSGSGAARQSHIDDACANCVSNVLTGPFIIVHGTKKHGCAPVDARGSHGRGVCTSEKQHAGLSRRHRYLLEGVSVATMHLRAEPCVAQCASSNVCDGIVVAQQKSQCMYGSCARECALHAPCTLSPSH
jgi:hypothetical protein